MAAKNSGTERNYLKCGICMDTYKTPRSLPTCGDIFCENCILTYASTLQQCGREIYCPVCGMYIRVPENKQVTLEWIQTFPLNTVMIEWMDSISEKPEQINTGVTEVEQRECDPCKGRGETVVGLTICMDCQLVYCQTCTDAHKVFKLSRNHRLIDTKEISNDVDLVDFFASFTKCQINPDKDTETKEISTEADFIASFTKCPNHPEKDIRLYCKDHDVVMCVVCALNDHATECSTINMSSYEGNAATFREQSEELTSQMKFIINHLNMFQTLRDENKTDLRKKLKNIRKSVEQIRDQGVAQLDNLVRHVTDVTKQIELDNEDKPDQGMSRISKIKELTEENIALLVTVGQRGSDWHKFISTHIMKTQLEEIGKTISEDDKHFKAIDAELKLTDDFKKVIECNDFDKLVHVKVNENESGHRHLGNVANYLRDIKLVMVEEHSVRPSDKHHPIYMAVSMHKDGRIILCDICDQPGCGHICLYNPENRTLMKLRQKCPYSATQIDDTQIAVCSDKTINLVTVGNELELGKSATTPSSPGRMVALNNGQLAVAWLIPPAFGVIEISDGKLGQISYFEEDNNGRKFKSFRYMAVDEKRQHVIQCCDRDNAIYCFDFTGEPMFRFADTGLSAPRSVALDKCGNIYVCQKNDPGSIYKLSPEGELLNIFTEGVPAYPFAICSDNTGTGFWVTRLQSSLDKVVYFRLEQSTQI